MKFTCSQAELSAALALVGRAVSTRPSHPVLANVLLTADAGTGRLSLTGFDLSLGIQASIPAAVETSGATTLPAKLFGEIISRLPAASPITLALPDEAEQAEITSLSGSYQVGTMPAADYPDLPLAQAGDPVELDAADLIRGLRATLFASSGDESKQLLTGVHLALGAATECAATDGHRLAVLKLNGCSDAASTAITVPARSLRELERLLSSHPSNEPLSMYVDRGQIVFLWGDQVLTSRSLDGTYPAYRQLIPGGFSRAITVNRRGLLLALERVAVVAEQHNNVVKLSADPEREEVRITADAPDVGSGSEALAAEIKGEAIDVAFNVRYLVDGLKAMGADEVVLQANAPTTPVVIGGDAGFTYLVMPVQVRS
jgi:DNA polymerase-3 subunit beta